MILALFHSVGTELFVNDELNASSSLRRGLSFNLLKAAYVTPSGPGEDFFFVLCKALWSSLSVKGKSSLRSNEVGVVGCFIVYEALYTV